MLLVILQPEEQRSLYNAKLFPVVRPFDVLLEGAGKDDMLWLASTGVSDIPDLQVLKRWVVNSRCIFSFIRKVTSRGERF